MAGKRNEDANNFSPMMRQYYKIKEQYPDMLLFFRLGDFYEMFFDDAKTGSEVLGLTLTGRDCGLKERAPMCGVPYHAADTYIAKLIESGYKVAICEQMEDPALAKSLVRRDVTRIITSGTVLDDDMLDGGTNNYLCSIYLEKGGGGICFADSSTAQFHMTALPAEGAESEIINRLSSFRPREIIFNKRVKDLQGVTEFSKTRLNVTPQLLGDEEFDLREAKKVIKETLPAGSDGGFEGSDNPSVVRALGAAVRYLLLCQKNGNIETGASVEYFEKEKYMQLDMNARRSLELTSSIMTADKSHSLLSVIDKTKTAPGKRLMRNWLEQPLMSVEEIKRRQQAVGELVMRSEMRDRVRRALSGANDMERLVTRVVYGSANARDLKALQRTIECLPEIKEQLSDAGSAKLREICNNTDLLTDVAELIDAAIVDAPPLLLREGGLIKKGYNEELDELEFIKDDTSGAIASMEAEEREKTGIPKLKIGFNKVFGYYIEVTNSYKDMVPETYTRKQTLTNGERYITPQLKELEVKILNASERDTALQFNLFCEVRDKVAAEAERLRETARAYANLDVLAALAETAVQNNYCCPDVNNSGIIDIKEGRHPVVEDTLFDSPFVPNDTYLDGGDYRCAIITGPNMAGKSTYMRQTALIVILAQMGSFVPAKAASIGVVDAIYTRVGAADDLSTGQSTFMVEMNEVSAILKNATKNSLLIFDEIGRGTSTFDGMSIARAVLEYSCKVLHAKTMFATHYHELTVMEGELEGVHNYSVAVKKRGDDITFLRRIVRGGADESFGIEVAKLAGVPQDVVDRAKVILKELEDHGVTGVSEGAAKYMAAPGAGSKKALEGEILTELRNTDVETLTPLEAFQEIYSLHKKAVESEEN